jgi:methylmalonyl-CoA mutase N-terminal domain/subunit
LRWQREVESGARVVVGVNRFEDEAEAAPEIFRPSGDAREQVLDDLRDVRATRDAAAVEAALDAVREAANGTANLMDPILVAVERYATLGEICSVLESVFGRYRAPEVL